MSPRAAWRLEQLGFDQVYDYTAGKVDWLAAGQPTEGTGPTSARVISALDATVPTCGLDSGTWESIERAKAAGWPICVVVNDTGVVVGRLSVDKIAADDHRPAQEAMEPGPATIRANDELAATLARMAERHVAVLLVTTPEGTLLGAVRAPQ
jgi:predicted transcriptional regulator